VGSAKEWPIAATRSSSATTISASVSGAEEMKPTPNGRSVRARTRRICSRSQSGPPERLAPIIPSPPAAETAAANSAVAAPAIGALRIGYSMPKRTVKRVWIMAFPFVSCAVSYARVG